MAGMASEFQVAARATRGVCADDDRGAKKPRPETESQRRTVGR